VMKDVKTNEARVEIAINHRKPMSDSDVGNR
jgi:hypothetical protein